MDERTSDFLLSYLKTIECWSSRDSNPLPPVQQTGALPTQRISAKMTGIIFALVCIVFLV